MNRKLSGKERALLNELMALMQQYDCLMYIEDNNICLDMEEESMEDVRDTMQLPALTAWYDVEYFMNKNS